MINQCSGALRLFAGRKEAKGVGAVRIRPGMQINLPDPFQVADKHHVLAQQFTGH
ncbi:hypothetical protein SDC9_85325 [bioreactor metagenome]|uniref:Uncharacterized protein n=1 Tax=bioreactor metagenome TaxID=1076179 RepID=A0A644ZCU0_9ZZZZ